MRRAIKLNMNAAMSEIGMLIQTPSVPKNLGRMISPGTRNSICLDKDRSMEIFDFPIDWKKLVITICAPTSGKTRLVILSPGTAIRFNSGSFENIDTITCGKKTKATNPNVVIIVPANIPYSKLFLTLANSLAP